MSSTVWFAFAVNNQELPTPDDIFVVSPNYRRVMDVIRQRAEDKGLLMSTSGNPIFQYEFRRTDNTIHSFISVKELPLI